MARILRFLFFGVIVRLLVLLVIGLNVRNRQRLPNKGPAIIIANHNSHLDTMVLISLLPLRQLKHILPVAAADYFLKNKVLAWFALKIIGILPISRTVGRSDPLAGCKEALAENKILLLFPEGSRGEPEHRARFKNGVARLAENAPDIPVVPVFLHGLGKALPKGEAILVPFFCDVFVGEKIYWSGNRKTYMQTLENAVDELEQEGTFTQWD
ncbi:MAG: 1-acyl-sn-glycerol-3-phosphate acyltransferase [Porticoccaceae bacterium]|nr:1-acyl-sn-glycerol-3-phosphate acyltransferase [Porticoccaceae bacterium]